MIMKHTFSLQSDRLRTIRTCAEDLSHYDSETTIKDTDHQIFRFYGF